MWPEREHECEKVISHFWDKGDDSVQSLKRTTSNLMAWGNDSLGNIPKQIKILKKKVEQFQGKVQTKIVLQETHKIKQKLDEVLRLGEIV